MSGNDPLVMMMLTRRRRSADGTNGNDDDRAATTRCTSSNDPLHGFRPFSTQIARRFRLADPHIVCSLKERMPKQHMLLETAKDARKAKRNNL